MKNNPLLSKPFGQIRNQAPTKVTFYRPRCKTLGFRRVFGFMMLIICASAVSLLLALRISESGSLVSGDTGDSAAVFSPLRFASNNSPDDAAKGDDSRATGRLQLVQLPSILTVFAPSDNPIRPVQSDSVIVDNDSMIAKIYSGEGTPVLSALDGTVKTVSFDEGLGGSLTVFSSDDIEITYYGLRDICVERGQPVVQRSILGNMQRDYICVHVETRARARHVVGHDQVCVFGYQLFLGVFNQILRLGACRVCAAGNAAHHCHRHRHPPGDARAAQKLARQGDLRRRIHAVCGRNINVYLPPKGTEEKKGISL